MSLRILHVYEICGAYAGKHKLMNYKAPTSSHRLAPCQWRPGTSLQVELTGLTPTEWKHWIWIVGVAWVIGVYVQCVHIFLKHL